MNQLGVVLPHSPHPRSDVLRWRESRAVEKQFCLMSSALASLYKEVMQQPDVPGHMVEAWKKIEGNKQLMLRYMPIIAEGMSHMADIHPVPELVAVAGLGFLAAHNNEDLPSMQRVGYIVEEDKAGAQFLEKYGRVFGGSV